MAIIISRIHLRLSRHLFPLFMTEIRPWLLCLWSWEFLPCCLCAACLFYCSFFAGLAILFSCLSKGQYARSGPAKAGMAIGISCITLATVLIITICTLFLVTDQGRSFMQDYFSIITSEDLTEEELYDFLNKYLYGGEDSMDDYNSYDNYDDYDDFENYEEFFEDELPYYYQQPEGETGDSGEGNFI